MKAPVIENPVLILKEDEQNLNILHEFAYIMNEVTSKNETRIRSLKSSENFMVYFGGSHLAVHQIINGTTQSERIIFLEF